MGRKKWNAAKVDKELASTIAAEHGIDPFASLLLASRGITDGQAIESFFSENDLFCDPFEIVDMEKAVERIELALSTGEKICIYGDYDADGVTATAVLYLYLEMTGANVTYYIPDRNTEGYGLNKQAIKEIHESGVSLIVTVDNGISAFEEADYAYSLGMQIVITDHHKVASRLPRAEAVVDAHREDCTCAFRDWSGVGIAFKLVCALSGGDYEDILDSYSDIISIGTIGDVVPLLDENRAIVRHGLKKINGFTTCGIDALRHSSGSDGKNLGATAVAFTLVPRINAIGRVEKALDAFRLLISDSPEQSAALAEKIEQANAERQRLEQLITSQAEKQLEENPQMEYDRVLVFDGLDWHGGVIGIVAARFVERYGKPCIVITSDGIEAKGSGRSIEGFSLYDAINSCASMLTHFGGHTLAAGFGLKSCDIGKFRKAINDYAKTVVMPFYTVDIDLKLRPEFISADILPVIESLEPFGAGNPQPLFGLYKMTLTSVTPLKGGKHLRLGFTRDGVSINALKFGMTPQQFPYLPGDVLDLAVRLEKNEYMGQVKVSIYIKEMRMNGTDDELYLNSVRLYEKIKRKENISASLALSALPDRKFVADVYRYIKSVQTFYGDTDVLCYRLQNDGSAACKVLVCMDILCELGIFKKQDGCITLADTSAKVNLENSSLMAHLKALAGK